MELVAPSLASTWQQRTYTPPLDSAATAISIAPHSLTCPPCFPTVVPKLELPQALPGDSCPLQSQPLPPRSPMLGETAPQPCTPAPFS